MKKYLRSLLFPHVAIIIILLPIAAAFLTFSMLRLNESSPIRIASYLIAMYELTVVCLRVPNMISFFKRIKNGNKYIVRWFDDARLRVSVSLAGGFLWNLAYSLLQLGLGIYNRSSWYYSLAGYYILLAVMRFFLFRHSRKYLPGEKMQNELVRYHTCGWIFLAMNIALSTMMFIMIYRNRTVKHHEIIVISMAAYTFFTLSKAIINVIKYRRYNSPVFSASKLITLTAALVSMLTLESTMLVTFDSSEMSDTIRRLFLQLSGGAVSIFIVLTAIYMIVKSGRELRKLKASQSE